MVFICPRYIWLFVNFYRTYFVNFHFIFYETKMEKREISSNLVELVAPVQEVGNTSLVKGAHMHTQLPSKCQSK